MRTPSSRSTSATTYGPSSSHATGAGLPVDAARRRPWPLPTSSRHSIAVPRHRGHTSARVPDRESRTRCTTAARTAARVSRPRTWSPRPTPAARGAWSQRRLGAEDDGAGGREHTTATVGDRDLGALDLPRSPHSPRNWRVASTSRNMPYWPGCVYESPPPFVFIGSAPPGPSLPSSTNAPPSPLAQKPRSSRCSSAVMVNES